jgi:hypothetical protein
MLEDIQRMGGVAKIGEFVEKVKDKNSGIKLMGFGHRVYKNYDPRAKLMRETCHEVLQTLDLGNDPLFKLAMALEKVALEDEYFVSRKLYPNVDFYSGIVQRAIGIPVSLFTAIFAAARTVGWTPWQGMTGPRGQLALLASLGIAAHQRGESEDTIDWDRVISDVQAGIPVIVVSNQAGVGRGYFSAATVEVIHQRLAELLARGGARC